MPQKRESLTLKQLQVSVKDDTGVGLDSWSELFDIIAMTKQKSLRGFDDSFAGDDLESLSNLGEVLAEEDSGKE